jgi:hypothetical protein
MVGAMRPAYATGKRSTMINDCALHEIPCSSKSI